MEQLQPSRGSSSSGVPKQPNHFDANNPLTSSKTGAPMHQFAHNFGSDNARKAGMPSPHPHLPPSSPFSQMPASQLGLQQVASQNFRPGPSHSRSLSQPTIFSLDSLPPLSPSPFREPASTSLSDPISVDVPREELDSGSHDGSLQSPASRSSSFWGGESVPSRKGHRRSNSDIPFGFSTFMSSSPHQLMLISSQDNLGMETTMQTVTQESYLGKDSDKNVERLGEKKSEVETVDDIIATYMNLDNINMLNPPFVRDKDKNSTGSGGKTNGGDSDIEVESGVYGNTNSVEGKVKETKGVKRSGGEDVAPVSRHYRSVSMDSFMGNMHFGSESPKPPPSPGTQLVQKLQASTLDESSTKFSLEFGSGEFSAAELEKIMANERLSEIAATDPKRAKRILANRQSAARSKERKMRYISELEHKVQTLQTEATTLSTQVTLLQRDITAITSQNNELKFRIQAMEQQAQLKDALNEALSVEVQRLRLTAARLNGDPHKPKEKAALQ